MGVKVSETKPEMRIATQIVTANSWKRRPRMPGRKRTGRKTAASEIVIDTMVKPISLEPSSAAARGRSPFSMCRTMFSSITMASSTTKPMESVSAMSDRLSKLYPRGTMTANVPTMDIGSARLGMAVAEKLRRKRKITRTTRTRAASMVTLTSFTDARIDSERSKRTCRRTEGGAASRGWG